MLFLSLSLRRLFKQSLIKSTLSVSILILVAAVSSSTKAATIIVPAGEDLQSAINASQCGDVILLQAGGTWDGNYILPNRSCTQSTPITIRSSDVASLPSGRVGVADAPHMPRIRAVANEAAFRTAAGAGWWILDGLEITDNAGRGVVNALVDLGLSVSGAHDITVLRCYFHQKETGTDYNRSAMRAVWFEGSNLTFKWNYVYLIGYYYPEISGTDYYQMDTTALLSVGGPGPILMEDNYISVWWNGFFLGGGDTAPQNAATLTGATMTSATFSNTTGLAPGIVIRFGLAGVGVVSNGSTVLTATSGVVLTSADVNRYLGIADGGATRLARITAINGNLITIAPQGSLVTDGTYNFEVYETAPVTSVSGSTVNYSASLPVSNVDALQHPPTSAAWNYGDQGLINDVTVRGNTFCVDPAFAHDVFVRNGYAPKGAFEIKTVNRFVYEGNYNLGYPANWAVTPRNQNGTAPWSTASHLIFRHNWFAPEDPWHETTGRMAVLSLQDELHTTTPATDIQVYNNFAKNVANMFQMKGGEGWSVRHNTIINDLPVANAYHVAVVVEGTPSTNWTFRDNVIGHSSYGMSCSISPNTLGTCWQNGTFQNNVAVDFANAGVNTGAWGPGSILGPIQTAFSQVGFQDVGSNNYSLSPGSVFKGLATDGTDPGVDMISLMAALGGAAPAPTPTPVPTPTPTSTPTPTPTPVPVNELGENILRVKRDGQDLSNLIASSGGSSAPGGGSNLVMTATEAEALELFITQIQTAFTQFNNDSEVFPAAMRIRVELTSALQAALLAHSSSLAGDTVAVRTYLREAINHLELIGVLIAYPNVTNPIDVASYVVRQHYLDFFDREPDQSGSNFWINEFLACGNNGLCIENKRINVSAAFFLSIEFQRTGYFVHRLYRSSYGRVPLVAEFMPDNAIIARGIIVGTDGWEARLVANQDQFLQSWVQRSDFNARYGSLTNDQYVDTLIANLGVTFASQERDKLIQDLANGATRATVLGRLAENEVFSRNEFNRAFVLMQYFGYLRRDPDAAGLNFWLNKLNQFDGDYQSADMVKAFLASQEYRDRFAL